MIELGRNDSSNITNKDVHIQHVPIFLSILCAALIVFVLASNLIVLIVTCTQKTIIYKRHATIALFLCISDVVFGISGIFFTLGTVHRNLAENTTFCTIQVYLVESGFSSSILHTFWVCFERYLAMINISWWKKMFGVRGRTTLMVVTWIFVLTYFGFLKILMEPTKTTCSISEFYGKNYVIAVRFIVFVLCPVLVGTLLTYVIIAYKLISQIKMKSRTIVPIQKNFVPSHKTSSHFHHSSSSEESEKPESVRKFNLQLLTRYSVEKPESTSQGNSKDDIQLSQHRHNLLGHRENSSEQNLPQSSKSLKPTLHSDIGTNCNRKQQSASQLNSKVFERLQQPSCSQVPKSLRLNIPKTTSKTRKTNLQHCEIPHVSMIQKQLIQADGVSVEKPESNCGCISKRQFPSSQPERKQATSKMNMVKQNIKVMQGSPDKNDNRLEIRAAKTVGIHLLVLCLTSGPLVLLLLVEATCPSCHVPRNLRVILTLIALMNSLLNPIINKWRFKELKIAAIKLTKCKYR